MKYHQLTSGDRYSLSALRTQGLNQSQIAKQLGRHRSTISRELQRNCARFDGHYRPSKAIERTSGRRSRSRRNLRFTFEDLHQVNALIHKQWSPQQVSGHLRKKRLLRISHETIYRHIWSDKACGGSLYMHLRGARKNCRKRYGRYDSRGKLAGKLTGDATWTALEHTFETTYEGEEKEMVCELRARQGEVWFDTQSLRLIRTK